MRICPSIICCRVSSARMPRIGIYLDIEPSTACARIRFRVECGLPGTDLLAVDGTCFASVNGVRDLCVCLFVCPHHSWVTDCGNFSVGMQLDPRHPGYVVPLQHAHTHFMHPRRDINRHVQMHTDSCTHALAHSHHSMYLYTHPPTHPPTHVLLLWGLHSAHA